MKQPPKVGDRRITKHFAIYKTIQIGKCNSPNAIYVHLVLNWYYVLEEYSSTRLGYDWIPVEYALCKDHISSTNKRNIPV